MNDINLIVNNVDSNNNIIKGFTSDDIPNLTYVNPNDNPNDNINGYGNGGNINGDPNQPKDPKYYSYLGFDKSNCIEFLKTLKII